MSPTDPRIVTRPAFEIIGKKTWIAGPDNELFAKFWKQCAAEGLFENFAKITSGQPGPQTNGVTLGVSRVEKNPADRDFYYMIAVEKPLEEISTELECFLVPASQWAVFGSLGKMPDALVESEIYAFSKWLPSSGFTHALAPEMEVYPPGQNSKNDEVYCEFWLPIVPK